MNSPVPDGSPPDGVTDGVTDGATGRATDAARPRRLFVGVRVSPATRDALEAAASELRRAPAMRDLAIRWLPRASYHITLKFLGWTRPEAVAAVADQVGAVLAGAQPLDFEVRGLGGFPKRSSAQVLWAGVDAEGTRGLSELAGRIDQATFGLGFPREKRALHPHVTLARLKTAHDLSQFLATQSEQVYRWTSVQSVVLFESLTIPGGSEYKEVVSWPLAGAQRRPRRQTKPVERVPGEPAGTDHSDNP